MVSGVAESVVPGECGSASVVTTSARKRPASNGQALGECNGKRHAPPPSVHVEDDAHAACTTGGILASDAARILRPPIDDAVVGDLGARLRSGHLVAFPTETVYGLGANGLDAEAVLKIFEAKGRPLSDPCILHVAGAEDALRLLCLNVRETALFRLLAGACWPGPLSIVGRAAPSIPREVTAGTGFAAVRCPAHAVARRLIEVAGVPLAAPSANRFGHISPTLPEHVLEDLGHWEGLRILDGGACNVGIESTVLKLDLDNSRVVILRKGGVTRERLEEILARDGAPSDGVRVEVFERAKPTAKAAAAAATEEDDEAAETSRPQEAPGMLLRHYAPAVPTVLLRAAAPGAHAEEGGQQDLPFAPESSLLVDFREQLSHLRPYFMETFDLCRHLPEGSLALDAAARSQASVDEACARAFAVLREAEVCALSRGARLICLVDFDASKLGGVAEALHDRLFRAASGRRASLVLEPGAPGEGQRPRLIPREE